MIIGIPKEVKNNENRVGMTPEGVREIVKNKHLVYVEHNAGAGSGFTDSEYIKAGAKILPTAKSVYDKAQMIIKIKEPQESEFSLIKKEQIIFTYLHLAAEKKLTQFLLKNKVTGIAYETVEKDMRLPLLEPMSQVAGRMSAQVGAHFLEKTHGGRGVLLGGTVDVPPANVTVLGFGIAGSNATQMAYGMGAKVLIFDIDKEKIKSINAKKDPRLTAKLSNKTDIAKALKNTDLLVSAVLIPGAKAPKLVTKEMIKNMPEGAVIVDIAIDQGGSLETSKPTSHEHPIFKVFGVTHYCVTNMPGAVARTSTLALTAKTLPYVLKLANLGFIKATKNNPDLAKGVNTYDGKLTCQGVANAFSLKCDCLEKII